MLTAFKRFNPVHRLYPDHIFPKIQKVTYDKLSRPPVKVTRFGVLPLDSKSISREKHPEKESIIFDKNTVSSKTMLLNDLGNLEGVLEIQIDLSAFINSLGIPPIFVFSSQKGANQSIQKMLLLHSTGKK